MNKQDHMLICKTYISSDKLGRPPVNNAQQRQQLTRNTLHNCMKSSNRISPVPVLSKRLTKIFTIASDTLYPKKRQSGLK